MTRWNKQELLAAVSSPIRPYKFTDPLRSPQRTCICLLTFLLFIAIFTFVAVWQIRSKPLKQTPLELPKDVAGSYRVIIDTFAGNSNQYTLSCICSNPRENPKACAQVGVLPPENLNFSEYDKCLSLFPPSTEWSTNGDFLTVEYCCDQFNNRVQTVFYNTPYPAGGLLLNPDAWASTIVQLYASSCYSIINTALISDIFPPSFWQGLQAGFINSTICRGQEYWNAVFSRAPPPWGNYSSGDDNNTEIESENESYADYFGCCLPEFCSYFDETSNITVANALVGAAGTIATVLIVLCGGFYRFMFAPRHNEEREDSKFHKGVEMAFRPDSQSNDPHDVNQKLLLLSENLQKQEENTKFLQTQVQELLKENKALSAQVASQGAPRKRITRISPQPDIAFTDTAFDRPSSASPPSPPVPNLTPTSFPSAPALPSLTPSTFSGPSSRIPTSSTSRLSNPSPLSRTFTHPRPTGTTDSRSFH